MKCSALDSKSPCTLDIDIVAWHQIADASLWLSGSKVEIFFGQINRDSCCDGVNHESGIRYTAMREQMFRSLSASHVVPWTLYKGMRKSNTQ